MTRKRKKTEKGKPVPPRLERAVKAQMLKILAEIQEGKRPSRGICTLCGKLAQNCCIYVPGNQLIHGAPHGKTRGVLYWLCDRCAAGGMDATTRVENIIEADLARDARNN